MQFFFIPHVIVVIYVPSVYNFGREPCHAAYCLKNNYVANNRFYRGPVEKSLAISRTTLFSCLNIMRFGKIYSIDFRFIRLGKRENVNVS